MCRFEWGRELVSVDPPKPNNQTILAKKKDKLWNSNSPSLSKTERTPNLMGLEMVTR